MTTTDNKPDAEEVPQDKPEAKEVASKGPIVPEDIISDILQSSPNPEEKKEEKEETKPDEVSLEKKEETTEDDKVFAKVGNREFKTQEDLTTFVTGIEKDLNSQKGFNGWITGAVKKMRPDLFNEDGSIKSADLQKIVEGASAKASEAAETMKELGAIPTEELTDEQKEDIKKARGILKPLGVVFVDDPKFKKMEEDLGRYRERDLESAQTVIDEFSAKHPAFNDHRIAIGELMDQRGYDNLEKAWKVYKAEQDIVEDEPINKPDDSGKNKSVDTTIPTTVKKEAGDLPPSGKKDIWDDVLELRDR
jgi:hypothetical protein